MNIKVWINDTEYTSQLEYAMQFTDVIDGGQDSGGFAIRNDVKTPFPQYSEVKVEIDETPFYWYISEDKVMQKTRSSLYTHNINLIERVKILEGYYLSNITFTQPLQRELALSTEIYTYKTAIERVLAITPLRIGGSGSYPKFTLDSTIREKLDKIEFPESFPTAKNLYEFMLNIGRMIAAVPYMTDWDTISFWFIDDAKNATTAPNYDNYFSEKTAEQYCTNIDITLNNVIAENDDKQGAIVEPSPTGFMFYRDETQIQYKSNDETLTLTLQKPIHKIKKLICRFKKVFIRLDGVTTILYDYDLDITSRLIEKTQYEVLPETQKANYIWYEYGKNKIGGFFFSYKVWLFIDSYFSPFYYSKIAYAEQSTDGSTLDIPASDEPGGDPAEFLYRVEYVPVIESLRCQIERKQDAEFRTKFSFAANQSDSAVSSRYAGQLYQQHIERIGKEARKYVEIIEDYLTDLPEVGSYFVESGDRYYLFKLNCQIVNPNKILLETFWSKDFTAISERIGLNALPRFTEITRDTSIRSDVFREHCILSNTQVLSNSAFFTTYAYGKTAGMRSALWNEPLPAFIPSGRSQCNFAYVRTISDTFTVQATNKPLLLPVSSVAIGNALSFSLSFKDNFSAGTQIKKPDPDKSTEAYYDVRYTSVNSLGGSFGRFESIILDFISDTQTGALNTTDKAKLLPEIQITDYTDNRLWSLNSLFYMKDTREVPALNYMLCFEGSGNIIVGEAFTKRNPLIATDNIQFIPYSSMERVTYNIGSYTWEANAGGDYVRYNGAVYEDVASRRYNAHLGGWLQNNTGTHFKCSRELRLAYKYNLINSNNFGAVEFDLLTGLKINTVSPTGEVPVWWFGDTYGSAPTFLSLFNAWAILDEYDNLVIGNNAKNFNPVYFNFTKEKTYANNI